MERGFGKVFNAWLLTVYSQSPSFTPCWMVKKVKSRRLKSGVKPNQLLSESVCYKLLGCLLGKRRCVFYYKEDVGAKVFKGFLFFWDPL